MLLLAAAVIAIVTIIVIIACYKSTRTFIEINDINIKDDYKKE